MPSLERTMTVGTAPEIVAAFLSDLTNAVEWDVYTRACARLDSGPLRAGARYEHTREYQGHEVVLMPTISALEAGARIEWSARHPFARGREYFTFAPAEGGGTTVRHGVDLALQGVARLAEARVRPVMARIADDGTAQLRSCLERLGPSNR